MGFRDGLRKGGGFWNNVDGVITGYVFTNIGPAKAGQEGEETEWVYFVPTLRLDGSDEETSQHMFLGSMDDYEIADNGQTLTSVKGDTTSIGANTPAGKFLDSLIEANFPEADLPDLSGGDPLNLSCIVGHRIRVTQRVDEAGTKKLGKRKGQDGKEYNRTDTVVAAYYGPAATTSSGKTKSAKGSAGKTGTSGKKVPADDVADFAAETLRAILKKAGGSMDRSNVAVKVLGTITKDPRKEAVRKYLGVDANLRNIDGVEFDEDANTLSLAA